MAAAITSPVQAPSGEPSARVGQPLVVAGTGWALTHAITVAINKLGVTVHVTSDGAGAFTTAGVADLVPQTDDDLTITVNDGTTTLSEHILVGTE